MLVRDRTNQCWLTLTASVSNHLSIYVDREKNNDFASVFRTSIGL